MTELIIRRLFWAVACLSLLTMIGQAADYTFERQILLSDPCAVFVMPGNGTVTPINYGEIINLNVKGTIRTSLETGKDGEVKYKFDMNVHGQGTGQTSGIMYVFLAKASFKEKIDPAASTFDTKFKLTTRLIGQGNTAGSGGIAQGAQDNALLRFVVRTQYANGSFQVSASDFTLECAGSPWTNLMDSPASGTKTPVGRGFGDPWNKYAWSMKDFNGGMVVGTKNAYFNYFAIDGDDDPQAVKDCINNPAIPFPPIYKSLACLELFGEMGLGGAATSYAEIWRFDYSKKDWTKFLDDLATQGFRIMETHNGKLYAGSDLGAFVTGVALGSSPGAWYFPGSKLLSSVDGKTFVNVPCSPPGPCNSASGLIPVDANVSFRALTSFGGKLYLGTFNYTGAELWSYSDTDGTWEFIKKFPQPAVTELRVYSGKLYIGLLGQPGSPPYLYTYDGNTEKTLVDAAMPPQNLSTNLGVLKLFVAKGLLLAGSVDLDNGFVLQSYDGANWNTITNDGFMNPENAYAWSMAEVDGRILLGTFNQNFFSTVPRGSAELWYSDDAVNWQQVPLPLHWGIWNYGIRTMEVGVDKQLYLGSASNMIAPGLPDILLPLSPGAEVWAIKTNAIDPKK